MGDMTKEEGGGVEEGQTLTSREGGQSLVDQN